jgi:hypothetical protein
MLIEPHTQLAIDKIAIDPNNIYDVTLETSIWEILPKLSFKIKDITGSELAKFKIRIGSLVEVSTLDASTHKETITLSTNEPAEYNEDDLQLLKNMYYVPPKDGDFYPTFFVIKDIFNGFEYSSPNAGFIQVECIQAWDLFINKKDAGYKSKISDIIKQVVKDSNRNNGIKLDKIDDTEYFAQSSDSGEVIRHSAGLCDLDFIKERLLPYLNINKKDAHFFIDIFGYPHLTNYELMYSKNPKIFAYLKNNLNSKQSELLGSAIESTSAEDKFPIEDIKIALGRAENPFGIYNLYSITKMGKNLNSTTAVINDDFISENRVVEDKGKEFIPISMPVFNSTQSSQFSVIPRWYCDSDKLLLTRTLEHLGEKRIEAQIEINYFSESLKVGDTLELFSSYSGGQSHWINGKWIVTKVKYFMMKDEYGKDTKNKMIISLMRRSVWVSKKDSSIDMPGMMV